jgi:uncharacterized transporter YbjL
MHRGILLGVCAGAGTATPALAEIQQVAQSPIPTLGYGVPALPQAVSEVIMTTQKEKAAAASSKLKGKD